MRRMDELHLKHPFFGSRMMTQTLKAEGSAVNRKRVQRLMRLMGLESTAPKPNTSKPAPEHAVYPYLRRNLTVSRINQVWAVPRNVFAQRGTAGSARATESESPAEDQLSSSSHSVRIGGADVSYTATAGRLVLRKDDNEPKAHMFFVAYTRDGQTDLASRPITFAYNGGPGSATIWLHMGRPRAEACRHGI